ncbi:MAG: tetratricopeptide repeat protein [Bdellovibrionaceae bacterium]|nr:tetratricopeptide repeat protein [Pseudobdellovibrionaceae bacterium]
MTSKTGDRQEKNWLIKSSTRILGPFSVDEVAQMLLKKHISIIDEVRQPEGRWKYVREHGIFDEVVVALRAEQANVNELTQTSTATVGSTAITRTDATAKIHHEEETPPPPAPHTVKSDLNTPFSSGVVRDITATKETFQPHASSPRTSHVSSYGSAHDHRVQSRLSQATRTARWVVLGLAVIALVGVLGWKLRLNMKKSEGYDSLIEEALRYRSLQLYDKSLAAYKKAILIQEPAPEVQQQMALVLIVLDRQNVAGRRILEKVAQDNQNTRAQIIDASLGIAISQILEGNLKEAQDSLQKVLVIEPANFNAHLNLGLISLRKGDWAEADRQLEELSRRSPPHPLVLLARGVSLLESGQWSDQGRAQSLVSDIHSYFEKSGQLHQELALIRAALMSPHDAGFMKALTDFLGQVSKQSSAYVKDLRLDWRLSDWDLLDKQCREFIDRQEPQPRLKAARAVCLAEAGRDSDSRRFLDEALAAAPKDPWVLFTQANLLYRSGLRNEAFAVLRMPELTGLPVTDILLGKLCLDQGDLGCAERSFRVSRAGGHRSIIALTGLADILSRQNRSQEAVSLIREGSEREPAYLPLIELRDSQEKTP